VVEGRRCVFDCVQYRFIETTMEIDVPFPFYNNFFRHVSHVSAVLINRYAHLRRVAILGRENVKHKYNNFFKACVYFMIQWNPVSEICFVILT
jgi:hypothetical protein